MKICNVHDVCRQNRRHRMFSTINMKAVLKIGLYLLRLVNDDT